MAGREMDLSSSGYGQAVSAGDYDNEITDSRNLKVFLDKLKHCNFSRMT
jgi:hypothetical protein